MGKSFSFGLALASASLLLCAASPAAAQVFDDEYYGNGGSVSLRGDLALKNAYVFRGQNLYNGASFQPHGRAALNTDIGTFYGGVFSHIGLAQGNPRSSRGGTFTTVDEDDDQVNTAEVTPAFDEVDFDLGHEIKLDYLTLDVGHRWYTYGVHDDSPIYGRINNRLQNTSEFRGLADFDILLHPHVSLAYDYDKHDGMYYETGLRQPIPLAEKDGKNSVIPFVKFGFTSGLDDGSLPTYSGSGLAFVDFGIKSSFAIWNNIALQPEVHYSEGVDDFTNSELIFGISLAGDLDL